MGAGTGTGRGFRGRRRGPGAQLRAALHRVHGCRGGIPTLGAAGPAGAAAVRVSGGPLAGPGGSDGPTLRQRVGGQVGSEQHTEGQGGVVVARRGASGRPSGRGDLRRLGDVSTRWGGGPTSGAGDRRTHGCHRYGFMNATQGA